MSKISSLFGGAPSGPSKKQQRELEAREKRIKDKEDARKAQQKSAAAAKRGRNASLLSGLTTGVKTEEERRKELG